MHPEVAKELVVAFRTIVVRPCDLLVTQHRTADPRQRGWRIDAAALGPGLEQVRLHQRKPAVVIKIADNPARAFSGAGRQAWAGLVVGDCVADQIEQRVGKGLQRHPRTGQPFDARQSPAFAFVIAYRLREKRRPPIRGDAFAVDRVAR